MSQISSGGELLVHELFPDGVNHRPLVPVCLDGNERGATDLVRAHHPSRELGRQRSLALTALPTNHRIALFSQQPLKLEEVLAAPDETGRRDGGQVSETSSKPGFRVLHRLL